MKKHYMIGLLLMVANLSCPGQSCDIFADAPIQDFTERTLTGIGHRECSGTSPQSVRVTVRLRQDRRWWFDRTLASVTRSVANGQVAVRYRCSGRGSQRVFTEIIVNGRKAKSKRVGINLCS